MGKWRLDRIGTKLSTSDATPLQPARPSPAGRARDLKLRLQRNEWWQRALSNSVPGEASWGAAFSRTPMKSGRVQTARRTMNRNLADPQDRLGPRRQNPRQDAGLSLKSGPCAHSRATLRLTELRAGNLHPFIDILQRAPGAMMPRIEKPKRAERKFKDTTLTEHLLATHPRGVTPNEIGELRSRQIVRRVARAEIWPNFGQV